MRSAFASASVFAMLASLPGATLAAPGDGRIGAPDSQTLPHRIRTPDGWSPVIAVQPDDGRFIVPDFQTLPPGVRIEGIRPGALFGAPPERILAAPVITLNGGRVAADDPEALAEFYKHAFGLREMERRAAAGILEIVLVADDDVTAAGTDRGGGLVIVPRGADDGADSAHIVLDVSNAALVAADAAGAGGVLLSAPAEDRGVVVAVVADPAGNRIELVQQSPAADPARG